MTHRAPLRSIVITGASGGLGRALAQTLSRPGRDLLLLGRDDGRLAVAADAIRSRGGTAHTASVDVQDSKRLRQVLTAFDDTHPVDLLICAAGVKAGHETGVEEAGQARRVVDINLVGTIETVEALVPGMVSRQSGRIALVGSLAGLAPHISLLSYSASKAGIHAYGRALRRALRGTGVAVTVIIPGFVDTPMTDRHVGPTPITVPVARAARIIATGLVRGRRVIVFPVALVALAWLGELLPGRVSDVIMARLRAEIRPDTDETNGPRK